MIQVTPFAELGRLTIDWLDAHYHFSFAHYYNPERMGFGPLRVWNDDRIQPGAGFDMHPHRDMEIITYVRRGAITHTDHLGNKGRTAAGDVQVMSAGSGILHAEHNLEDEVTEIFQIWVPPRTTGRNPVWATRRFPGRDRGGRLVALASGQAGMDEALPIDQDATLFGATLAAGHSIAHDLAPSRLAYLVASRGSLTINQVRAAARDGAAVRDVARLDITATDDSELLLFDLPPEAGHQF